MEHRHPSADSRFRHPQTLHFWTTSNDGLVYIICRLLRGSPAPAVVACVVLESCGDVAPVLGLLCDSSDLGEQDIEPGTCLGGDLDVEPCADLAGGLCGDLSGVEILLVADEDGLDGGRRPVVAMLIQSPMLSKLS
jgi:hypothetical protein